MRKILLLLLVPVCSFGQITIHGRRGVVQTGDTVTYSHIYNVGTGTGDLTIDGNVTTFTDNSIILIAPGTYGTIQVNNINPTHKVTIRNGAGLVLMDGMDRTGLTPNYYAGISILNCSNLLITGDGQPGTTYGLSVIDQHYRPTAIDGINKNVTFQWLHYDNVSDQAITTYNSGNIVWDGTDATVIDYNMKFLNIKFSNFAGGPMSFSSGQVNVSNVTNLHKRFEVYNCIFDTDNSGDMMYAGALDGFQVHNCQFLNCNLTNNNDNGLVHVTGNGDFYNNYMSNCQGHAIRWWSLSFGSTQVTCHGYNNIYVGSRKYSPFEWQTTVGMNVNSPPNTTYCNFIVVNNIGGNLNYEHHTEFDACLVDNYSLVTGAVALVANNLLYNTFTSNGAAGRMFQFPVSGGDPQYNIITNNYEATAAAAVFNETTLTLGALSPEKNAGTPGYLQTLYDYHGLPWNTLTPSIGAVQ